MSRKKFKFRLNFHPKSKKQFKTKKKLYLAVAGFGIVLTVVCVCATLLYVYRQQPSEQAELIIVPMSPKDVDDRRDRIEAIYASLNLGSYYILKGESVFGAKKQYSYDKSRTFSSEKDYIYNATVDVTASSLKKKIEAAGFAYFDEPYPGSTFVQYHFKSQKGEYIRLSVSSKPRDDDIYRRGKTDAAFFALDPNAAPSNVIIKVNLDDNNE